MKSKKKKVKKAVSKYFRKLAKKSWKAREKKLLEKPRRRINLFGEVCCTEGHETECTEAQGKECKCQCGGKNHGKARQTVFVNSKKEKDTPTNKAHKVFTLKRPGGKKGHSRQKVGQGNKVKNQSNDRRTN